MFLNFGLIWFDFPLYLHYDLFLLKHDVSWKKMNIVRDDVCARVANVGWLCCYVAVSDFYPLLAYLHRFQLCARVSVWPRCKTQVFFSCSLIVVVYVCLCPWALWMVCNKTGSSRWALRFLLVLPSIHLHAMNLLIHVSPVYSSIHPFPSFFFLTWKRNHLLT